MEPNLVFVNEPIFIHQIEVKEITEELHEFHIESDSESMDIGEDEIEGYRYCVLSVDIGVLHLGISVTTLDEDYNVIDIIWIDLIDITQFKHEYGVSRNKCKLYHTKTFCDWLNHTYQENFEFFNMADFILVERQPPMGFVVVEQLICLLYTSDAADD